MRCDGRIRLKVVRLDAVVWLDSDGSMLRSRGVIKPPPSTAMGMINSRGLFLMGCEVPVTVDCDRLVPVVSVSESAVDWRDSEPELQTHEWNHCKFTFTISARIEWRETGEMLTVLWYWNWCVHRPVAWAVVVWWLYAPLAPGWLHAPAASSWWGYTVWDPHVVVHYANQPQDAAFRCWNASTAVPAVVALQCVAWYPIEFPIWHWFYDAAMWPTWALWKRLRFSHPVAPQWLARLFKLKLKIKFSLDFDGYLAAWLESEHKWLARRFNQVLLRAKNSGGRLVG